MEPIIPRLSARIKLKISGITKSEGKKIIEVKSNANE
jgi:hypothetical protein